MIRKPAVAGRFYPADPDLLRADLTGMTGLGPVTGEAGGGAKATIEKAPRLWAGRPAALALLVPHAGYVYSGRVAGETYASSRLASRVVILCPNHTGMGEAIALCDSGAWATPLGEASIDAPLAAAILQHCRQARVDWLAHSREHALEVQLPFLQHLVGAFAFVPVCVGTLHLPALIDLGNAIAAAVRSTGSEALLVISSDLSHYVPAEVARRQDRKAIDRVLAIDPEGLLRVVEDEEISMCGIAPAFAGLSAARILGARQGHLVAYANSGDTSGDHASVVGYAGIAIH
jgi:hypothetical protein